MKRILHILKMALCCMILFSCSENSETPVGETTGDTTLSEIAAMSFNVRYSGGDTGEHSWDNRKAACLAMIAGTQPTLIGMQEVRPDQKTFFEDNLKNYTIIGLARDGSGSSTEYSSVCFRSDIFILLDHGTFWLSATPDFMSKGWDGACHRICTWTKLRTKNSGKELFFFNTHIDHKGTEAQKQGLWAIQEKIKQIAGDGAFVILTGDFNMQPDNSNITGFATYMKSVRDQFPAGKYFSSPTFNGWGPSGSVIDYIWYRNASPVSYEVINGLYSGITYISDHYPIMGKFSLQ
jgi:endonuclease/exonuclease/phosphatase family metal-dependent hydrolase